MNQESRAYQEALDYLYSFVDYSLTRGFRYNPEAFDLGRMVRFLELLGNPHRSYQVIHVAGTKGKGSTAAMIASALRAAGYRTGFYTSPHLSDYTERIQVDGVSITPEELVELVELVKPVVPQVERLTTFEITTAIGFLYFQRKGANIAVVEVGLGGRLDATNVVEPLVSVITSLSMDHMAVLGDTLEKIAFEKAGIIKPGRPVVSAPQHDAARAVIDRVCRERDCPLVEVGWQYNFRPTAHSLDGQSFQVWSQTGAPVDLTIPLLGLHQVENAATAYAALQTARQEGLKLTSEHIQQGFASVIWPGRFELLRREPPLVVDSAHNRDSAHRLRQALDDYLPDRPVILIYGASEDKDVEGMFAELMPRVNHVIATQSVHPRAADPENLVALARQHGRTAEAVVPLEAAVEAALRQAEATRPGAVVVAAGSLFIAAAVRDTWLKRSPTAGV